MRRTSRPVGRANVSIRAFRSVFDSSFSGHLFNDRLVRCRSAVLERRGAVFRRALVSPTSVSWAFPCLIAPLPVYLYVWSTYLIRIVYV